MSDETSKPDLKVIEGEGEGTKDDLLIDPIRWAQTIEAQKRGAEVPTTGVFVRAKGPGGDWHNTDILLLTSDSLLRYLKKDGGDNQLAEDIVGILVGHGRLHSYG